MEHKGIKPAEFARLCNTTKRTLHYYDEIGLFRPALVDANGYRYYSEEQCDVFYTINCLTDIGMSLSEIKDFSDHRTPLRLRSVLLEQQEKIQQERRRLDRIESIINTKLEMVDQGLELLANESTGLHPAPMQVEVVSLPEEYFVVSDRLDTADPQLLLKTLCQHINYHKDTGMHGGAPYSAILSREDWEKGLHNYAYYSFRVSQDYVDEIASESRHRILRRPAGTYAVYFLRGDFHLAEEAIHTLLDFAHANHYELGNYIYKEAVLDEVSEKEVGDYLTRIAVEIKG